MNLYMLLCRLWHYHFDFLFVHAAASTWTKCTHPTLIQHTFIMCLHSATNSAKKSFWPHGGRPVDLWTVNRDALCSAVLEGRALPAYHLRRTLDLIVNRHTGWIDLSLACYKEVRMWEETELGEKLCSKKQMEVLHGVEMLSTENRAPEENVKFDPSSLLLGKQREGILAVRVYCLWGHVIIFCPAFNVFW